MFSASLRTSETGETGAPTPSAPTPNHHHVALLTPSPVFNNNALDHYSHAVDGDGDGDGGGVGSYNRSSRNEDNHITPVSTTAAGDSLQLNTASAASNNSNPTFAVKDKVDVASRTWPGMNKQGGSAIITEVHASGAGVDVIYTYDVKYIIGGGREKNLDQKYISPPVPDEIKARAKKTRGDRTRASILGQSTVSSSRPSERRVKKRKTQERQSLSSDTTSMEVENVDTPTTHQTTTGLRTVSVDELSDTSPDIPPTTSTKATTATTATNGFVAETEELQDPDSNDDADEYKGKETLPKVKKKKKSGFRDKSTKMKKVREQFGEENTMCVNFDDKQVNASQQSLLKTTQKFSSQLPFVIECQPTKENVRQIPAKCQKLAIHVKADMAQQIRIGLPPRDLFSSETDPLKALNIRTCYVGEHGNDCDPSKYKMEDLMFFVMDDDKKIFGCRKCDNNYGKGWRIKGGAKLREHKKNCVVMTNGICPLCEGVFDTILKLSDHTAKCESDEKFRGQLKKVVNLLGKSKPEQKKVGFKHDEDKLTYNWVRARTGIYANHGKAVGGWRRKELEALGYTKELGFFP